MVWSHNTTISRSTGFTPFKLLFGDEAITPEEAKAGSIRTVASTEDEADYSMAKDATIFFKGVPGSQPVLFGHFAI